MKRVRRPTYVVLAAAGIAGAAYGVLEPDAGSGAPVVQPDAAPTGAVANMHFTDGRGNPRNPTAAEARAAALAFARDLDRLAGPHRDKPNVRTVPSGAVAATVATSRMSLLYAVRNEDGTVSIGHTQVDGELRPSARELPEE